MPLRYSLYSLNASIIAINSLSWTGQLRAGLLSFLEKNTTGCSLPLLSRQLSQVPTTKFDVSVSILYYFIGSSSSIIGSLAIRSLTRWNACSCFIPYWNSTSFFVKLYRGRTILLQFLMNIRQKLANPVKPRTSVVLVGIGYTLMALTLVSSIQIYPSEISQPRKTVFVTQNSLLSLLTESFYIQSTSSTAFIYVLCSVGILEKIRMLSR